MKEFEDLLLRVQRRDPLTKSIEQEAMSKLPLDSVQSNLDRK